MKEKIQFENKMKFRVRKAINNSDYHLILSILGYNTNKN